MRNDRVWHRRTARAGGFALALMVLAGCEEGAGGLGFLQPTNEPETEEVSSAAAPSATRLVERDVESPEVFQVTEAGLWDGRPSLGGVWVAHPDVAEPERVIIRNSANGKFVIGALFRRERDIPGPRIQTSSDAAAALGMLAGAPVELNVTALRREAVEDPAQPEEVDVDETVEEAPEVPVAVAAAVVSTPSANPEPADAAPAPETSDPIAAAGATLDEDTVLAETSAASVGTQPPAPTAQEDIVTAELDAPSTGPAPTVVPSPLQRPFLQIGIYNIEENANRTAEAMRKVGIVPTIYEQSSNDKPFWRVVVGPARSTSERSALLRKIKEAGFDDAYAVTN